VQIMAERGRQMTIDDCRGRLARAFAGARRRRSDRARLSAELSTPDRPLVRRSDFDRYAAMW
jgi:ribosome maturation factor RimP